MVNDGRLPFRKLTMADRDWFRDRVAVSGFRGCEYSFGTIFLWDEEFDYKAADYDGFLIAKASVYGRCVYFFPAGDGDLRRTIVSLAEDCEKNGGELIFGNATTDNVAVLERLFPGAFSYAENRNLSDYIYLRERLATLAGKKLHGKRNHIARFKDNPDWSYEAIDAENIGECREMSAAWYENYIGTEGAAAGESIKKEARAVGRAFGHFDELGLAGGLIRREGAVVAFTIGERLNADTFVIHIEKAFHEIQGAYAIINQQFAERIPPECKYVNREEDMGDESLRRSKLSYYPDILLTKHVATLKQSIS